MSENTIIRFVLKYVILHFIYSAWQMCSEGLNHLSAGFRGGDSGGALQKKEFGRLLLKLDCIIDNFN